MNTRNLQRSVLGQRRQRCLKEPMHANWKCQEGPRGTCITEPLVTATAANPTLAHSLFHAVRVSTFPGYQTSYLSMQHLYREKASVWFNSFHAGRGSAPNSNAWLMQKRKSIAETAHPPGPSGQKQTQQRQDATFFTCTWITFSLTSSDFLLQTHPFLPRWSLEREGAL